MPWSDQKKDKVKESNKRISNVREQNKNIQQRNKIYPEEQKKKEEKQKKYEKIPIKERSPEEERKINRKIPIKEKSLQDERKTNRVQTPRRKPNHESDRPQSYFTLILVVLFLVSIVLFAVILFFLFLSPELSEELPGLQVELFISYICIFACAIGLLHHIIFHFCDIFSRSLFFCSNGDASFRYLQLLYRNYSCHAHIMRASRVCFPYPFEMEIQGRRLSCYRVTFCICHTWHRCY